LFDQLKEGLVMAKPMKIFLGLTVGLIGLFALAWPYLPAADVETYFEFIDRREMLGIPNALDVLSNLAFLVVGLMALRWMKRPDPSLPLEHYRLGFLLVGATLLTAVGSGYFHWNPNPETLFWDRLPMTLAFSGVTALVIVDRIDRALGMKIAYALVPLAALTVVGWGQGWLTLKPYIFVQFGSMIFILFIVAMFPRGRISNSLLGMTLGFYVLAKVFEVMDIRIYYWTGLISGHSIKHIVAAVALWRLLTYLRVRVP
jgi:hypothetical protein